MLTDSEMILRLVMAVVLGGLVGWEREVYHKPAGFRTHILVCLGACLFTIISYTFPCDGNLRAVDPSRIASGIVMGVGFLGAGAILHEQGSVKGLTTAASIWVVAAIGMATGAGFYTGAIITAVLVVIVLFVLNKIEKYYIEKFNREKTIEKGKLL